MFNALKYIKNLEAAGLKRHQAEAQVQLVIDAIEDEVATKSDIAEIKSEMASIKGEISAMRVEFGSEFSAVRSEFGSQFFAVRAEFGSEFAAVRSESAVEFAKMRAEISEFKAEIVFKLGTMMIGCATICTAILGILIKF